MESLRSEQDSASIGPTLDRSSVGKDEGVNHMIYTLPIELIHKQLSYP